MTIKRGMAPQSGILQRNARCLVTLLHNGTKLLETRNLFEVAFVSPVNDGRNDHKKIKV